MSARKKSTSTDESSSGSSTESTSSSGSESGSDTGSSGSESDSSSSTDPEKQSTTNTTTRLPTITTNNSKSTTAAFRRKSSETKQQTKIIPDEKLKETVVNSKTKSTVNRGQRLSKSSVYSSDEENNPVKKSPLTKSLANQGHKKQIQNDTKKPILLANTSCGGKAPPAVVKQQQQQQQHSSVKISTKQPQSEIKSKPKIPINEKNKSIFSPDNSSDSDNKNKFNEKILSKTAPLVKPQKNQQQSLPPLSSVIKAKAKSNIRKVVNSQISKKNERKRLISTDTPSSTDDESSSNSSTHSDDDDEETDSTSHSSPPTKKPALATLKKQSNNLSTTTIIPTPNILKQIVNKSNDTINNTKTVVLSDSDNQLTTGLQPVRKQQQTIRKLTRSSSTRKSKHLTGKPSDTDSDIELNKSRSISKSPVKKSSINIVTKSKTKVKKSEMISSNALLNRSLSNNINSSSGGGGCISGAGSSGVISPIPEIQKCPIEGCDSTGHLSGNHNKHFLPEACPIFHNMSTSECKDRTIDRKLREDEQSKIISHYDAQKIKIPTSEQKIYLSKIREARARFKPLIPFPMAITVNDKVKNIKHNILDRKREPNLIGLVADYDLQLFREAQAIASEKIEKEFQDLPVGKGIKYILMGKHQMKVWYQSPYPEDVARIPKMYICEFCLRYQKSEISMKRHSSKCVWRHPPGDEIYRKGKLQVWQVDGKKHKQFCQHLCLLAKFFLDHKTLYYEVEPFLFYVMTLANYEGCHIVGYFSKEKNSYLNYNVSCILTLPPYQRKGYGRLLIDFSYLLTRVENKIGSPEKPLSDLGLISYRSYWKDVLLDFLCTRTGTTLSIKDLSQEMAINSYDIVSTLQALGMMKYWKGKHIVLKKQDVLEEYEERIKRRGNFPKIDASCLRWNPFIPPQTCGST